VLCAMNRVSAGYNSGWSRISERLYASSDVFHLLTCNIAGGAA
jgi:hypothetical protein